MTQGPDWQCVTEAAPWQGRDSQGDMVFQDHLWVLGGWFTPDTPNPRDVWKSPDGKQWQCVTEQAPWEHSDLPVALAFNDRLWLMGGRKLPGKENSNQVWSSPDGKDWTLECKSAGWSPRVSACHVVFKNRMWVFGGTDNFYEDTDDTLHNDVWSTADGKDWKCEVANAAWPRRTHAQGVVFNGKIWILGGGRWLPHMIPHNDVWCSDDGVNWDCVTEHAAWDPRIWFDAVVYRNRLWVLGGWSKEHGNFGDVWYTKNGRDWTELKSDVIWSKRHEPSCYVHKDRIFLAGGHAEPVNSEVWSLFIPEAFFDSKDG